MATLKQLLKNIEASPDGPEVAAIFDFDGTLIAGYSVTVFIREQIRRGDLSVSDFLKLTRAMVNFGMGNMGFSAMMLVNAQFMRGISEQSYRDIGQELYESQIARLIYPESRALVEAHQAKGHTLAVISSATPYQVEPAAQGLDIEHILCTYLEVENGEFTGGVVRPTCFGEGKVRAAEELAATTGADLDQSFFYSDSTDDIELLDRVGRPQPLNPSRKLKQAAEKRHWKTASFSSRGRPTVAEFIRSVAATSSLVTSFAAALPIWALTGSKRQAQNFSFSLFADTASALIGMDLNIKGEAHLWTQRPCVFVFNHQSKADVVIMAKLLRRDVAGIGKKEIRDVPVIGQVMEFGGTVFVDRANASSAIEAMRPLVDALQKEGRSVVVAPEGTRTVTTRLAPFKKGPFHLAMQAGVPMVPIVIRNALDVAPKGDFVFRSATVDVEVLPPVDTTDWSVATIDDHVADVRAMFQRALGQVAAKPEEPRPKKPGAKRKRKSAAKSKPKTKANSKAGTQSKAGKATPKLKA